MGPLFLAGPFPAEIKKTLSEKGLGLKLSLSVSHLKLRRTAMPNSLFDSLPLTLRNIKARPLFVVRLDVKKPLALGTTPLGGRRISVISGGLFEGSRLSGKVLEGGSDWQVVRADGAITLDVRLTLQTAEGDLIGMTYQGLRAGSKEVFERLDKGEAVDPAEYYFRSNPLFETSSPKYDWLNRIIAVGLGHRLPDGPVYSVFEVL
jgi:hypothetical protein